MPTRRTGPCASAADAAWSSEGPGGSPRVAPRRHGDFRLGFFRAVERAAARLGGRALYRARHLAPGRFRVREERVVVEGLPHALDGLSIAQLSDLHGGPFLGRGDLDAVVEAVNALEPDVCALTGDYVTHGWAEALPLVDALGGLRARLGTYAVFGNHDYRGRQEQKIADALEERGVRFLRDACARVGGGSVDGEEGEDGPALALVGLEDLEEAREVDLARARAGVRPGDVEVHLCHNPMGAPVLARAGARLVLSGHTHGTQLDLPFLRRLGPQHPGARVELGGCTLLVSRGLGVIGFPVRVGAPAEVVVARLARA